MLKRKLWWGLKQGYTPLQWIQGDGRTQYVDFDGYYPDENWAIEIVATPKEFGTQGYCHAYGAGSASSASDAVICVLNGTGGTLCRFVGTVHSGITIQLDTQYTIYQDANICTANGDKTPTNSGTASGTALSYPLRLFRNPTATEGNLPKLCGVIQFSSVRAWNKTTGKLILDVVPVLDKDGVPCFWDRVGNKLYYNKGTGSFTYKEWDYTPCDYVYADGDAYINTQYYGDENTATEVYVKSEDLAYRIAIGSRTNAQTNNITTFVCDTFSGVVQDFGDYRVTRQTTSAITSGNYVRCYNSKNERWILEDGGTKITTTTTFTGTLATPTPIYIGYRGAGSYPGTCSNFKGNYKEVKIYQKGILVRNYIPAVDGNNKAGFYDELTNTMVYSIGNSDYVGHFIEGGVDYKVVKNIIAEQVATATNTNACPYIKTGVIPGYSKKTRMVAKFAYAHTDTTYEYFCGMNYGGRFIFGHAGTNNKVYFGLGAQNYTTDYVMNTDVHLYKLDWATAKAGIDDNEYTLSSAGQYDQTGDFWINGRHATNYANVNRPMGGTSYWWKFWNGKKLVYNGIPVVRASDNKVGLFETVNRAFQTTAGTVEYTYTE